MVVRAILSKVLVVARVVRFVTFDVLVAGPTVHDAFSGRAHQRSTDCPHDSAYWSTCNGADHPTCYGSRGG